MRTYFSNRDLPGRVDTAVSRSISLKTETNGLLERLRPGQRSRFVAACAPFELNFGETLIQAGSLIGHVYLPTSGYLSITRPIDGHHIEVSLAGHEGMFGWALGLGSDVSEVTVLVQGAGSALRLTPRAFRRQMRLNVDLRRMIARYTHVLITQVAQAAGCNRFHVVEQRLARWLLTTCDRARSPSFRVTQESLASMLGVRRAGVTEAAGRLQAQGLISYRRGEILVRDRRGLEQASCSCYAANAATYRRILGRAV